MLIRWEQLVESCASNGCENTHFFVKETITSQVLKEHKGPGHWDLEDIQASSMKFV